MRAATSFADCSLSSNPACAIPVPTVTPCAQPWISPTKALAITDEASPFALRSTRNHPRTAVRRGAARPRRSDQAAAGETLSRAGRRPHRRACMGCRAPQAPVHKNTVGRPSARSLGVVAQEVRIPAAPSSPCPRPRPASGVQCPVPVTSVHACLSTGPMSSVRCGRLSVQCPLSGVQCPLSGVRCLCVAASAVSGRSEVLERGVGRQPYGWDGRVGVVARCLHARLVVCLSRRLVLEADVGGAGPAEVSVWTWPSSWEVVGQWPARPRGRPGQGGCTRGSFVGRDPGV